MKNPLVSIIMPVYNAEEFVSESIHSILTQTYDNIELIIINDGSSDNSETVIKNFKDERIRYYFQANQGQAVASNLGLTYVLGEYVKFFDADDLMNDSHIEFQLNKLNGSVSSIASCAWGRFYNGNPSSTIFEKESVWQDLTPINWLKYALKQEYDMMAAWLWLIPKKIIDLAGGWDERLTLNNDFEFSIRLLLHADNILFTEDSKVYYRSGVPGSLSLKISKQAFENAFLSTYLGCSYLLKVDNSKNMRMICANRYQQWVYRMYPNYRNLEKKFEEQIRILGGSNRKLEGGFFFKVLTSAFGWKAAKRLKFAAYKFFKKPQESPVQLKHSSIFIGEKAQSFGKVRVIHCVNYFLPKQVAGTEIYVWALSKQLQSMGCHVSVLIPNYHSEKGDFYEYDGLSVFAYAEPSVKNRELITGKRLPDGLKNFSNYLKIEKPNIIHFHEIAGSSGIGVPHFEAARATGAKIVFTVHLSGITCSTGTLMFENKSICDGLIVEDRCAYCALVRRTGSTTKARLLASASKPLSMMGIDTSNWQNSIGTALSYPFLIKRLKTDLVKITNACHMIIPITKWYYEILLSNNVPAEKMQVVQQALPYLHVKTLTEKNVKLGGPLKLIFIGRIDELKGISLLLESVKDFTANQLMLDIYGNAPDVAYINACKKVTSKFTHISWMGKIEQRNVLSAMQLHDALILPSMFSEMSPLVIQEAFAAGIPVIGSNVYGIAEQIKDGINGYLFDFGSKESLKLLLQKIIDDKSMLSKVSYYRSAPRTFESVAKETLSIYNQLLAEKQILDKSRWSFKNV